MIYSIKCFLKIFENHSRVSTDGYFISQIRQAKMGLMIFPKSWLKLIQNWACSVKSLIYIRIKYFVACSLTSHQVVSLANCMTATIQRLGM